MSRTPSTTTSTCGSCGAAIPDGYLCNTCTRGLRSDLTDLAPGQTLLPAHADGPAGRGTSTRWDSPTAILVGGLAAQLEAAVTRQARIGGAGGKRGKGETAPVPFNERASEIRALLVNTLGPWAAWVHELERPAPQPPACSHRDPVGVDCRTCAVDERHRHAGRRAQWARRSAAFRRGDVTAMASYLLERVNVIVGREEAPRLRSDVRDAVRRVERVIDRPGDRLAVGECGAELPTETVCQRPLYADPSEAYVVCPTCKTRWSVAERRAWLLASAEDSLGTAATISAALTRLETPVTVDRIYQWKHRGRLVQHGNDERGAPLYRLGDVVDLLVEAAQASEARAQKKAAKKAS